jgi:hypothetical protein
MVWASPTSAHSTIFLGPDFHDEIWLSSDLDVDLEGNIGEVLLAVPLQVLGEAALRDHPQVDLADALQVAIQGAVVLGEDAHQDVRVAPRSGADALHSRGQHARHQLRAAGHGLDGGARVHLLQDRDGLLGRCFPDLLACCSSSGAPARKLTTASSVWPQHKTLQNKYIINKSAAHMPSRHNRERPF